MSKNGVSSKKSFPYFTPFPKTIYMWPIDLEVKELPILEGKKREDIS